MTVLKNAELPGQQKSLSDVSLTAISHRVETHSCQRLSKPLTACILLTNINVTNEGRSLGDSVAWDMDTPTAFQLQRKLRNEIKEPDLFHWTTVK